MKEIYTPTSHDDLLIVRAKYYAAALTAHEMSGLIAALLVSINSSIGDVSDAMP